ncbi:MULTISPECIES: carbohydrate ABC transporter permease [Bacillales]|uniref:carbohydrate ABC transporter permease n=1 Tax=Bacillales TaxID=1385 RepID=UPI001CD669F8|nr:carbohydrate ABC transporter permease [Pseudalkalibacillus hwajinpoensis]MCA0991930.1 carbohydrate ABC transporter permease [Pseudalkalibacillus hwajinpoensis]
MNLEWIKKKIVVLLAWLLGFAMFFPFIWLFITSIKPSEEVYLFPPEFIPSTIEWVNYLLAWDELGLQTFINSTIFTSAVLIGQAIMCLLSGFALAKIPSKGQKVFFILLLISMMVPNHVSLVPTFVIIKNLDWINTYQGLIIPMMAQTGFGTFLFRQFLAEIPDEMVESAKMDGANWFRIFISIFLPLSKPIVATFSCLTFLTAWNMYLWPLVLTQDTDLWVLTLKLAEMGSEYSSAPWNVLMAANLLAALPVIIIFLSAQRFFVESLASTGMKN